MTLSTKIIIAISAIVAICLAAFIIYKEVEISKRQQAIETEIVKQKELVDGITRSMNEYASKKDIEKFIKDNNVNLQAIKDDMSKLHAEISAVNVINVVSNGYQGTNIPSSHSGDPNPNPTGPTANCNGQEIPCPNADPYGYLKKRQDLTIHEPFGDIKVPVGEVGFSAWRQKPWTVDIRPRTYHVTSVVGMDENQRQYFYNKFSINIDGKDYDVKIASATTKQQYPEAKFSWWNPRLFMGIDGGFNISDTKGEFSPNLSIGIMSYGRYKNQPDFSILQLGVGYGVVSNKPQILITPISYNIGKHIPLMNNVYVGPSIYAGTSGAISIMGGIRVAL